MTWIGDHPPRHVHVFESGRLVVKWNLERGVPMVGAVDRKILRLSGELMEEGRL